MRLTAEKKRQIRKALVAKTFPEKLFSETASPLLTALESNTAINASYKATETYPQFTSSDSMLSISVNWQNSVRIPLPRRYARIGGFEALTISLARDDDDNISFRWTCWKPYQDTLPDLNAPDIRECLLRIAELARKREALSNKLETVIEKISSPKALIEKIPATAEYLEEEIESAKTQTKAIIPMDMILRIRKTLGYAAC